MARGPAGEVRGRSASNDRFVTPQAVSRSPPTTVTGSTAGREGGGPDVRSAITERYVTPATGQRHADTTVAER